MIIKAFFLMFLVATAARAESFERLADFLMWFPAKNGAAPFLWPTNAVASIEEVARLQAQAVANATSADMLASAMSAVEGQISQVEAIVAAQESTLYIDRMNALRLGSAVSYADDTNVIMRIVDHAINVGNDGTYQTNVVWGWCSVDPGFQPYIRCERNLNTTNEWALATVTKQAVVTDVLVGDTLYDTLYKLDFITPIAWGQAFFRMESEVRGTSTNLTYFVANNGFATKGNKPVTFRLQVGTNVIHCVGGGFTDETTFRGN